MQSALATLRGFQFARRAEELRKEQVALENPEHDVQLAQADLEVAEAALDIALAQQEGTVLKAPSDGVVLRVLVQPGRLLQSPDIAVWFKPDRPWIVRCDIDQQFINRVTEQMPCDICEDRGEGNPLSRQGRSRRCMGRVAACSSRGIHDTPRRPDRRMHGGTFRDASQFAHRPAPSESSFTRTLSNSGRMMKGPSY